MPELRFFRSASERFATEYLSDGSLSIVDTQGDAAHSLNQSAAAIWQCCNPPATIAEIAATLSAAAGAPVSEAVVVGALEQLERVGLVGRTTERPTRKMEFVESAERRAVLRRLALGSATAAALPIIWSLTGGEQRLHAQGGSAPLNLTGCWRGRIGDSGGSPNDPLLNMTLTQTAGAVTGSFLLDFGGGITGSGTVSGTATGASVNLTLTGTQSGNPSCTIGGTFSASSATNTALPLSGTAAFGAGCSGGAKNVAVSGSITKITCVAT